MGSGSSSVRITSGSGRPGGSAADADVPMPDVLVLKKAAAKIGLVQGKIRKTTTISQMASVDSDRYIRLDDLESNAFGKDRVKTPSQEWSEKAADEGLDIHGRHAHGGYER
jgi:hypothetical protein